MNRTVSKGVRSYPVLKFRPSSYLSLINHFIRFLYIVADSHAFGHSLRFCFCAAELEPDKRGQSSCVFFSQRMLVVNIRVISVHLRK